MVSLYLFARPQLPPHWAHLVFMKACRLGTHTQASQPPPHQKKVTNLPNKTNQLTKTKVTSPPSNQAKSDQLTKN